MNTCIHTHTQTHTHLSEAHTHTQTHTHLSEAHTHTKVFATHTSFKPTHIHAHTLTQDTPSKRKALFMVESGEIEIVESLHYANLVMAAVSRAASVNGRLFYDDVRGC